MPAPTGYSRLQISLHWIIALLILTMFFSGEVMGEFGEMLRDSPGAQQPVGVYAHIGAGISVLVLVLWRIAVRLRRGAPAAPNGTDKRQEMVALIVHLGLYAVMVIAPISGLLAWFGGLHTAEEVHEAIKPILIVLLVLHIAGALYHQYVLKDGLLRRMMKAG